MKEKPKPTPKEYKKRLIELHKIECPLCLGWGNIDKPKTWAVDALRHEAVRLLKKEGFSIREIMRKVGYKSPRAVSYILNKKAK